MKIRISANIEWLFFFLQLYSLNIVGQLLLQYEKIAKHNLIVYRQEKHQTISLNENLPACEYTKNNKEIVHWRKHYLGSFSTRDVFEQ